MLQPQGESKTDTYLHHNINRVFVSGGRDAGELSRVILDGVHDAQAVLQC